MYLAKLLLVKQFVLYNSFRFFIAFARILPTNAAGWLFFMLRSLVVCYFALSSWVEEFVKSDIFNVVCVGLILILVQVISNYFSNNDANLSKQDVLAHQNICATLEHLKQVLASKSLIEKEAEAALVKNRIDKNLFFEALKKDLLRLEDSNESLKIRNSELEENFSNLKEKLEAHNATSEKLQGELREKTLENDTLKQKLDEKRSSISKQTSEIKKIVGECDELRQDKMNLTADVLNLKKLLMEIKEEGDRLKREIKTNQEEKSGKSKKEMQKFTEELKLQISSAKGRLSRVGSVLGDGQ